ncbi:lipopolysaccharide assembly protein LapA domain-containing protein [Deferribacter abyssi]|uniref:lipopolysaccharide assembly protein LapA domain-containing protein n=1 Tax=Deferribacter abyssi TaxID=213806 RepID=UPI003C1BA372
MKTLSTIIKTIIIALIALFAAFNMQSVDIKYFFNKPPIQLPLFFVVLAAFILGVIISAFIAFTEKIKLKKEINSLKKENKELEKEIIRLKNLPLSKEKEE